MKRNLIVLGCAGILAFGLSSTSFAGHGTDTDGDGVPDTYDNCVNVDNGPTQHPTACYQDDANLDGYGNLCDADINNDGLVGIPDLSAVLTNLGSSTAPHADLNCDGLVGIPDLSAVLTKLGTAPGASGLACAGTPNCFAQ